MATHFVDTSPIFNYIVPIYVGDAAKKISFPALTDQAGLSISGRNHIYGELTALFWLWKNSEDEIIGLCHYRRFFDLTEMEIDNLLNRYQVVLPRGYRLKWRVDHQFIKAHYAEIWDQMLEVLYGKYPQYIPLASEVFSGNLLYRHNMFIARRAFVDAYCSFVFDVLFELEKIVELKHDDHYQQRYAGFVSERLFTLYILGNHINGTEKRLINASGRDISPGRFRQLINNLYFRMIDK